MAPNIEEISPLAAHLAKRKPLQGAIGKGIEAPAGITAPQPATATSNVGFVDLADGKGRRQMDIGGSPSPASGGITALSQAAPKIPSIAEVRSGYPAIESGPIRLGEPGFSRLRVNSTQQGIAVPGAPAGGIMAPAPASGSNIGFADLGDGRGRRQIDVGSSPALATGGITAGLQSLAPAPVAHGIESAPGSNIGFADLGDGKGRRQIDVGSGPTPAALDGIKAPFPAAPAPSSPPAAPVAAGIEAPPVSGGVAAAPTPPQSTAPAQVASDYDMAGYTQKYGQPDQSKGQHLTDEFKLPNHITFSSDSKYSTPEKQGGSWKQEGGKWHFYASPYNMQNNDAAKMQDYFARREPNSVLHLPPAPAAQVAPQPAAPVGQSLTSPSAAPMPVHPNAATADPQKILFKAAQGIDGTGIMQPIDTTKIGIDSIGAKADPLQKGFTGSGIVAGQQPNSIDIAGGLQSQREAFGQQADPVGIANFKDDVQKATRVNAANGIMPTSEQMKTAGMSNADVVNLLTGNNRNGQFGKGIEAMQTQQGIDVAASKAKAEMANEGITAEANRVKAQSETDLNRAKAESLKAGGKLKPLSGSTTEDGKPIFVNDSGQVFTNDVEGQRVPYTGKVVKSGGGGGGVPNLDAQTIKDLANKYAQTSVMPPMGYGKEAAANRSAVLAAWSKSMHETGGTVEEQLLRQSSLKASQHALGNDEKQYDMMSKSEKQAGGAAKLLRASSKGYDRGGVKFFNSMEALGRNAVNDPKLADLQMKLNAFSREYYKVTTNAYATGSELSIGAQAAADKMLNGSDSYDSLEAKIAAAEQEISNTSMTFKQTIDERKDAIKGVTAAPKGQDITKIAPENPRVAVAAQRMVSDMRGFDWNSAQGRARFQKIHDNLKATNHTDDEIDQAFLSAHGGA